MRCPCKRARQLCRPGSVGTTHNESVQTTEFLLGANQLASGRGVCVCVKVWSMEELFSNHKKSIIINRKRKKENSLELGFSYGNLGPEAWNQFSINARLYDFGF